MLLALHAVSSKSGESTEHGVVGSRPPACHGRRPEWLLGCDRAQLGLEGRARFCSSPHVLLLHLPRTPVLCWVPRLLSRAGLPRSRLVVLPWAVTSSLTSQLAASMGSWVCYEDSGRHTENT